MYRPQFLMIYSVNRESLHLPSQIEEAISSLRFKVMFQSIHIWAKKKSQLERSKVTIMFL